jgi:hypothetical protein
MLKFIGPEQDVLFYSSQTSWTCGLYYKNLMIVNYDCNL